MAIVNEVVTKFSFQGSLTPQKTFNQNLTSSIKLMSGMIAGIGAAGAAMFGWAHSVFAGIDPLVQLSRETGVAVQSMSELGYVASVNGSSLDAVKTSMAELTKKMGEFENTGGGRAAESIKLLGLNFRDASGRMKTADEVMIDVQDKMRGLSNAQKISFMDKLGIDRSLLQTMNLTGQQIDKLRERARKFGTVTQQQGSNVADYNDSLTTLKYGLNAVQKTVAVGFAPAMTRLVESFTDLLAANKDWIINGLIRLGKIVVGVIDMLSRMWPIILGIGAAFVAAKIGALGFSKILGVIISPATLIMAAIAAVILIVDDLIVAFNGGQSVIKDFFASFGIDIVGIMRGIFNAVSGAINDIINVFKPLNDTINSLFSAVISAFTGDWGGALDHLADAFKSWIEFVRGLFSSLLGGISSMWTDVLSGIKKMAMNLLPDWAIKLISKVSSGAKEAYSAASGAVKYVAGSVAENYSNVAGMLTRDQAVSNNSVSNQQSTNIDQNVSINISSTDPARAGEAVADSLQRQLYDARIQSARGGR